MTSRRFSPLAVDLGVGQNVESSTELLTADQVAIRWQVTKAHVYRLAREGVVDTVNLGGRLVRFRLDAIEAFECAGGARADA